MSLYLAAFSRKQVQSSADTQGWDMEGHTCQLPIQLRDDVGHSLGSTNRIWNDVLGNSLAITPQILIGAIHGLLGGIDSMDCGPPMMPKLSWMTIVRETKQLLVQKVLLTVFMKLWYFSWFTPITNMGHQQKCQG